MLNRKSKKFDPEWGDSPPMSPGPDTIPHLKEKPKKQYFVKSNYKLEDKNGPVGILVI